MPTYDETREAERKLEKEKTYLAKDNKDGFPEAHNLKENVVGLARSLKETSVDKAHVAADYVNNRVEDLKYSGADALKKIETRIKEKPSQSVAIAFAAGILASFLLGRRSS